MGGGQAGSLAGRGIGGCKFEDGRVSSQTVMILTMMVNILR